MLKIGILISFTVLLFSCQKEDGAAKITEDKPLEKISLKKEVKPKKSELTDQERLIKFKLAYEALKIGMTKDQVTEIAGSTGTVSSENEAYTFGWTVNKEWKPVFSIVYDDNTVINSKAKVTKISEWNDPYGNKP